MPQVLSSKYSLHSVNVVLRAFCLLTPDFTQCIQSHSALSHWPRLSPNWVHFFSMCLFANGFNFSLCVFVQLGSIFPFVIGCSWVQFFPMCLFSNGLNFSVCVCLQMGSIFPYVSVCSWVKFFLIHIQLIPIDWTNGKVWAFHKCVTWWYWHLDTIQVSGCPLSLNWRVHHQRWRTCWQSR